MSSPITKSILLAAIGLFAAAQVRAAPAACDKERHERGMRALAQLSGQAGQAVVAQLAQYAPELACMTVDFAYGEVLSRPQLTPRQRELASVAMLAAMGTARPQLKVHLHAAFNVGLTRAEIMETILQAAVYAGFPAAINGVTALREVEQERAGGQQGG